MRFLKACRREKTDATPVWFMRQAGRYMAEYRALRKTHGMLELCRTPELAAEVTLQPVRAFEVDAAILFADILLPLPPMGVALRFAEGEGPRLSPPVRTEEDVDRLRVFDPEEGLGFVLEAVKRAREKLSGKVPLIGFAGAPFTLAAYAVEGGPSKDYVHVRAMMRERPELWDRLMAKLAGVSGAYLRAQARAGAQALQLFDSWAGVLSPDEYARFAAPYTKKALDEAAESGVPLIHFGTGTGPFLEQFRDAGGDVVGVDQRVPLDEAWRRIGYDRAVQGNLDPAKLSAPLPELKEAVADVLRRAGGRPGHIFNLGHGIPKDTPPDRVKAVVEWVREMSSR